MTVVDLLLYLVHLYSCHIKVQNVIFLFLYKLKLRQCIFIYVAAMKSLKKKGLSGN